jgi:hypothetical protein
MKKSDVLKAILAGAAGFVPGGPGVQQGIEKLLHRNTDPDDDVDEVADAIAEIAVNSMLAIEGLTEKDFVRDDIYLLVVENIKGEIKLLQQLVVRGPKPTTAAIVPAGRS